MVQFYKCLIASEFVFKMIGFRFSRIDKRKTIENLVRAIRIPFWVVQSDWPPSISRTAKHYGWIGARAGVRARAMVLSGI
jgi:hypothetical protein